MIRYATMRILSALALIIGCYAAQAQSAARLSLTSQPIMTADTTSSVLHYTDGISLDLTADISQFAVGAYHVFIDNGSTFRFAPITDSTADPDWVGSINVSVTGQLTADVSEGYDRKWEIYNAWNQRDVILKVITQERDLFYCPQNQYPSWQPFHGNALNRGTVFSGEPVAVEVVYIQGGYLNTTQGSYGLLNVVGWDGTVVGEWGGGGHDDLSFVGGVKGFAHYVTQATAGAHIVDMRVAAANNTTCNQGKTGIYSAAGPVWGYNADANVLMTIRWRG